jgi:UDP-glucose:(heptosyl)LPS alpha-1,3-glucosyltransferase
MMKIAYIVRHYNRRGGISRYVTEIAEWFSKEHEVHVFTSDWNDVNSDKIQFHKVPIVSIEYLKNKKKYALNLLFEVSSFRRNTKKIIKEGEFDIIHTLGDYSGYCNVYTAQSCHRAWLKIAQTQTNSLINKLKKSTFNPLHRAILAPEDHIINTCKRIISVSNGVKNEILDNYKVPESKIITLPNGVDINKFNPSNIDKYRKEIRKQYGFCDNDSVMIFPAHQFERKGLEFVLKAMHKINNPALRLLIVGRDSSSVHKSMANFLEVDKQLVFTGETAVIERLYAASDLMIFPTIYEPFGMVITEAMATGLPVIVSKIAGAAELMTDRKDGLLLKDFSDINEIADGINYCINNKEAAMQMGKEARITAEKYTWNYVAEKTLLIYQQVVKEI